MKGGSKKFIGSGSSYTVDGTVDTIYEMPRAFNYKGRVYLYKKGTWILEYKHNWEQAYDTEIREVTDKKLINELNKLKVIEDL